MDDHAFEGQAPRASQDLKTLKVLVIDGREITRLTLTLLLESRGAEVSGASSQSEALAHLSLRRFDAIVTDEALAGVARRGGRTVLEGLPGPSVGAPVFPLSDGKVVAFEAIPDPAGIRLEVGGAIDPAGLCARLASLAPPPAPKAAAA
jgi:hypothetical protein